ncbi:MAG: hypothetical protein ACEPOV_02365 [Hyphomicrobiales bacterium]
MKVSYKFYLLIISLFVISSCENTQVENINGKKIKTSDWMYEIYKEKPEVKLTDIALVGTHHSLTDLIRLDKPLSQYSYDNWSDSIRKKVGKEGLLMFSQNQSQPIIEQLENGVRYFDFHLQSYKNTIWSFHNFVSNPIQPVLDQISTFIRRHPKEIIIINLRRLNVEPALYDELLQIFIDRLSPHIARVDEQDITLTLGDVWGRKRSVIFISSYPAQNERQTELYYESDKVLMQENIDKFNAKEVITDMKRDIGNRAMDKLYISFAVQTPTEEVLINSLRHRPKSIYQIVSDSSSVNSTIKTWFPELVKAAERKHKKVNILLFDQYQSNREIMRTIIKHNIEKQ